MASTKQQHLLLLPLLAAAIALFSVGASARPGLHFHPCNTFLISYSFSVQRQNPNSDPNPNPNPSRLFAIFTSDLRPITADLPRFFLDRPNFVVSEDEFESQRPRFLPRRSSTSVVNSLRDRTKDIISVVVALLFGVGCGFLTAATMYLAWSLFSNRFYDLHASYNDDDDDDDDNEDHSEVSAAKKMGYVKIPAADSAVSAAAAAAAPAKSVV